MQAPELSGHQPVAVDQGTRGRAEGAAISAEQRTFLLRLAEDRAEAGLPVERLGDWLGAQAVTQGVGPMPREVGISIARDAYAAMHSRHAEESEDGSPACSSTERSEPKGRAEACREEVLREPDPDLPVVNEANPRQATDGRSFHRPLKTKEELDELGRDPAAVNLWLETVSPSARIELEAPCLLPGHSGVGCVSLDRRTQIYKYRCDCAKRVWWWLPELYAARHDGRIEGLGKGERCSWTRRLFLEAGVPMALPPEESIGIPPAPADATDAARRLRDGFVLLVRLKAIGFADQSVLYSRRFAARWNALTLEEAQQGIAALRVAGVLRRLNERGLPYFHSGLPRGWRP